MHRAGKLLRGFQRQFDDLHECAGQSDTCVCNQAKPLHQRIGLHRRHQVPEQASIACSGTDTCIFQTAGIYTGVCESSNVNWTTVMNQIQPGGPNFPQIFKNACPSPHSFQFDDQASDWFCYSTVDRVVNYTVTFCGIGGKGS